MHWKKCNKRISSEDKQRDYLAKQLTEQNDLLDRLNQTQSEIARLLKNSGDQNQSAKIDEELRSELRLMTKTIANALASKGSA